MGKEDSVDLSEPAPDVGKLIEQLLSNLATASPATVPTMEFVYNLYRIQTGNVQFISLRKSLFTEASLYGRFLYPNIFALLSTVTEIVELEGLHRQTTDPMAAVDAILQYCQKALDSANKLAVQHTTVLKRLTELEGRLNIQISQLQPKSTPNRDTGMLSNSSTVTIYHTTEKPQAKSAAHDALPPNGKGELITSRLVSAVQYLKGLVSIPASQLNDTPVLETLPLFKLASQKVWEEIEALESLVRTIYRFAMALLQVLSGTAGDSFDMVNNDILLPVVENGEEIIKGCRRVMSSYVTPEEIVSAIEERHESTCKEFEIEWRRELGI